MRFKNTLVGILSTTVLFSGITITESLKPTQTVKAATATYKTSSASFVGQLKTVNSRIYTAPGSKKSIVAGAKYTNEIFYIMKKATLLNGEIYYQISRQNSANATILGWVKSKSLTKATYKVESNTKKTRYIKGTGAGYTRPGGLARNVILPKMSLFKDATFTNTKTVKIGTTLWYSASFNNLTVWLPSTALANAKSVKVSTPVEKPLSKIAKLKTSSILIQTDLQNSKTAAKAGILANNALIVTKSASYNGVDYYNITQDGEDLGWVKQSETTSYNYIGETAYQATQYMTGGGYGYTIPWGGKDDIITKDLTTLKDTAISITKKAVVGKTAWYYGKTTTGKEMWISSSRLTTVVPKPEETTTPPVVEVTPPPVTTPPPVEEKPTAPVYSAQSKQGVLKTNAIVYKDLTTLATKTVTTNEKTEKFTISQSAKIGNTMYYELSRLSTAAKATVVGWVTSTEVTVTTVTAPAVATTILYLSGEGNATNIASGTATGNIVFADLKSYPATKFTATQSQKIGTTTYYLGKIGAKYAWVSEAYFGQPFRYFNLRKVSNISQAEMEAYLVKKKGATIKTNNLYKNIPDFLEMQKKYGINAQFMLAHAIWETGWGGSKISQYKNNFFGYQAYDSCAMTCAMYFPTGQNGIQYYADAIYRKYLKVGAIYNNGASPAGMNVKYATDKTWAQNIARLMEDMKPYDSAYYDKVVASTVDPVLPIFNNTNIIPAGQVKPPTYHDFDTGVTATVTLTTSAKLLPYVYGKVVLNYAVGTKIILNGTNDDVSSKWMRVIIDGTEAWVSRSDIKIDNLGQTTTEANVRNKATTTNSTVLTALPANTFFKLSLDSKGAPITEKDASNTIWYKIQLPGKTTTGWISSTIVKIN